VAKDAETQTKTDNMHEALCASIRVVAPDVAIRIWTPPKGKDMAEYNQLLCVKETRGPHYPRDP